MVFGGLWHGAGWTFVLWGALHGVYLVVNHAWLGVKPLLPLPHWPRIGRVTGVSITFIAVCVGWVYFRAPDIDAAHRILLGMCGANGISLPAGIGDRLGPLRTALDVLGVNFTLGGGARLVATYAWVALAGVLVFAFPNTQQIMLDFRPGLGAGAAATPWGRRLVWRPSRRWAAAMAVLAAVCLVALDRPAEFLYFQF